MKKSLLLVAVMVTLALPTLQAQKTSIMTANDYQLLPNTAFLATEGTPDGYYNKTFIGDGSGNIRLSHYFSDWWGFGGGFTYSNQQDTQTASYDNLSAYAGSEGNFFIANASSYCPAVVETYCTDAMLLIGIKGVYVTNATYAALSMLYGDAFAKKFGGADGTDPDWLKLVITGENWVGGDMPLQENTVEFYLADFRSDDPAQDYIVSDWRWIDLAPLGDKLFNVRFNILSSDVGDWGINTPTYFCMEGLEWYATGLVGIDTVAADNVDSRKVVFEDGKYIIIVQRGESVEKYTLDGRRVE